MNVYDEPTHLLMLLFFKGRGRGSVSNGDTGFGERPGDMGRERFDDSSANREGSYRGMLTGFHPAPEGQKFSCFCSVDVYRVLT